MTDGDEILQDVHTNMWVEFVQWLSSLLRGFFSGFSGFPPSIKTNISKFAIPPACKAHLIIFI